MFNMNGAKSVSTPLGSHFKMSRNSCPTTKGKEEMADVPYSATMRNIIYDIVCARPDISHEVSVVSRFLSKS